MPPKTLLDTDILSLILRGRSPVIERASEYLTHFSELSFSIITVYEVYRGLKAKNATTQLARFEAFCKRCEILPLSQDVVDIASNVYANLHQTGDLIGDADILIASTAIAHQFVLSTNNIRHFERIEGLVIDNWNAEDS